MRRVLLAVTLVLMCANGAFAWNGSKATSQSNKAKDKNGPNTTIVEKVDTSLMDKMLTAKYRYTKAPLNNTQGQQRNKK